MANAQVRPASSKNREKQRDLAESGPGLAVVRLLLALFVKKPNICAFAKRNLQEERGERATNSRFVKKAERLAKLSAELTLLSAELTLFGSELAKLSAELTLFGSELAPFRLVSAKLSAELTLFFPSKNNLTVRQLPPSVVQGPGI